MHNDTKEITERKIKEWLSYLARSKGDHELLAISENKSLSFKEMSTLIIKKIIKDELKEENSGFSEDEMSKMVEKEFKRQHEHIMGLE